MKVIVFANKKGGVTKTTSSINLAAAMGFMGKQVLFIDTDAQCNSTSFLLRGKTTLDPKQLSPSIYDVLLDEKGKLSLDRIIRKNTREENVHLLPSSIDMDGVDLDLSKQAMWGMALERRREEMESLGYDIIIIDTPPGSAFIKTICLYFADLAILPTVPSSFSVDGLVDLIEEIAQIQSSTGKSLDFRFLMTRMGRTRTSERVRSELKEAFEDLLLKTEIPEATIVSRAEEHAQSLIRYAPQSKPAESYAKLLREVLEYV